MQSSPTSVVTYTYDSLGRLSTVNTTLRDGSAVDSDPIQPGNQPESTSYFYDLLGRPDYTVMPGGIVEDFSFDNMDRLDLMRHFASDSDNSNLSDNALKDIFDYSYRADVKEVVQFLSWPSVDASKKRPSCDLVFRIECAFYQFHQPHGGRHELNGS